MLSLIISDIIGDPLHLVAGGPTVLPPLSAMSEPLKVVHELGVSSLLARSVLDRLSWSLEGLCLSSP